MRSHKVIVYTGAGSKYGQFSFTSDLTPETPESLAALDEIKEACEDFENAANIMIRMTNRDLSKSILYFNPAHVAGVEIKEYEEPDEEEVDTTPAEEVEPPPEDFRDNRARRRRR